LLNHADLFLFERACRKLTVLEVGGHRPFGVLREELPAKLEKERVATVTALVTVGFSFDDELTVNSDDE